MKVKQKTKPTPVRFLGLKPGDVVRISTGAMFLVIQDGVGSLATARLDNGMVIRSGGWHGGDQFEIVSGSFVEGEE